MNPGSEQVDCCCFSSQSNIKCSFIVTSLRAEPRTQTSAAEKEFSLSDTKCSEEPLKSSPDRRYKGVFVPCFSYVSRINVI